MYDMKRLNRTARKVAIALNREGHKVTVKEVRDKLMDNVAEFYRLKQAI